MEERIKDHYFADSWEQAAQIDRDINRIQDKITFLNDMKRKLLIETKLTLPEITRIKSLCLIPNYPQFVFLEN